MIVRWLGPTTWPAVSCTCDFRVGGRWSATLESTAGQGTYHQFGVYLEIVPEERLVFTFKWATAMRMAPRSTRRSPSS